MASFAPDDLDILSRAFENALEAAPHDGHDAEERKAILLTGILDAAKHGIRDEDLLTSSALAALDLYEDAEGTAVIPGALL